METNSTCPDSTCKLRNRVTGYCTYTGSCIMVQSAPEKYERKLPVMEGLTKIGYDEIINRVTNMVVTPPHGVTIVELKRWLEGHADAQACVLSILNEMKDQYGR